MNLERARQNSPGQARPCLRRLLVLGLVATLSGCQPQARKDQVCFASRCFDVEVAATVPAWSRGLQGRTELGENQGMLFIFPTSKPYAFWMKDTLIPLDMVWLDSTQKVVHLEQDVPPCQKDPCPNYVPSKSALYVLEIKAGTARQMGLRQGDRVSFQLKKYLWDQGPDVSRAAAPSSPPLLPAGAGETEGP